MRILSVLTYYDPHWTGLTAHARALATGLAARGHHTSVLAHRHEASLPLRELRDGVHVERVRPVLRLSRGMLSPGFSRSARRLIDDHDIVLIHSPMLEALPVALAGRRSRRPVVVVHHGDLRMPAGVANRTVERVTSASMAGALRIADRVTAYSQDYFENSAFLLPWRRKLTAIAPPVDIPEPDRDRAAAWRAELGLADAHVVGFAGRFVEEKGGDILLRALRRLRERDPRAHLVIAGDTAVAYEPFFERCRDLLDPVAAHVTLLGVLLDRAQLSAFYAMCDVLALPSRSDCFALVQVEAMLCGTPVVASAIPGARGPVRETGMGRLVPPESPAALADGLAAVLEAPEPYHRSRAEIRRHYSTTATLDAYEALLEDLGRPAGARAPEAPATETAISRAPLEAFGADDRAVLEDRLRRELDLAYRRRLIALLDYLELRDGEQLLDAGCGAGAALAVVGGLRRLRLTGLDRDGCRLARGRSEGVAAGFVRGDLTALPFAAASFDKALASEVLEHVPDDLAALRELHRVLRPGAPLAISVPHADYPFLWDPIARVWSALGGRPLREGPLVGIWSGHRRLYWPEDLARRVAEAGFEVERLEQATHSTFPFAHLLLYGVGRPLLERGWLPARLEAQVDRNARQGPPGRDLLAPLRGLVRAADRPNEASAAGAGTFVNVLLKARRP